MFALIAIPLATDLALQLLPADPNVPGAMTRVFWILALGLASGIVEGIFLEGPGSIFRAVNMIYLGLIVVGFVEGLQSSYAVDVTLGEIRRTILAIGMFGTAVAAGSLLPTLNLPRAVLNAARSDYSTRQIWRLTVAAFCLAMLTYAIPSGFSPVAMLRGLMSDRWSAPWTGSYLGGWQSLYQHLEYFGYVLPALTAMMAVRTGWRNRWVAGGALFTLVFLLFDSQSGGRRGPVAYLGAGGLAWLAGSRKRLKMGHWLAAGALVLIVALFTDFMLKTRNHGAENADYGLSSFTSLRADDNFRLMSYALRVVPEQHPFVGWRGMEYFVAYPVPRAFWPGKPTDMGMNLAEEVGARGVSYTMTAAGEFYVMFGWTGLIAGGLSFGWLAAWWTQLLRQSETVLGAALYSLGAMALFAGIRSLLVLIEVSYPILVILLLHRWTRREAQA